MAFRFRILSGNVRQLRQIIQRIVSRYTGCGPRQSVCCRRIGQPVTRNAVCKRVRSWSPPVQRTVGLGVSLKRSPARPENARSASPPGWKRQPAASSQRLGITDQHCKVRGLQREDAEWRTVRPGGQTQPVTTQDQFLEARPEAAATCQFDTWMQPGSVRSQQHLVRTGRDGRRLKQVEAANARRIRKDVGASSADR